MKQVSQASQEANRGWDPVGALLSTSFLRSAACAGILAVLSVSCSERKSADSGAPVDPAAQAAPGLPPQPVPTVTVGTGPGNEQVDPKTFGPNNGYKLAVSGGNFPDLLMLNHNQLTFQRGLGNDRFEKPTVIASIGGNCGGYRIELRPGEPGGRPQLLLVLFTPEGRGYHHTTPTTTDGRPPFFGDLEVTAGVPENNVK